MTLEELQQLPPGALLRSEHRTQAANIEYVLVLDVGVDHVTAQYYEAENDPVNSKWMALTQHLNEWDLENFWPLYYRVA